MQLGEVQHFHASYDMTFVVLSIVLAAVGSFAALASAARIPAHQGAARAQWVAATAVALGGGAIWSMHFVGMLAYHLQSDITFDATLTFLSAALAVAVVGIGIWIVAPDPASASRLVTGGTFAGLGVAAMHYTGMAAMRTAGNITYDHVLVTLSVVIAVVAATAAFWIAFHVGGTLRVAVASLVMAAAVCGMHYTAMRATRVTPTGLPRPVGSVDPLSLGYAILLFTFVVLVTMIFVALGGSDPASPLVSGPGVPAARGLGRDQQSDVPGSRGAGLADEADARPWPALAGGRQTIAQRHRQQIWDPAARKRAYETTRRGR